MTPCEITAFIGYGKSSLMSKDNIFVGQECDADAGEKHLRTIAANSFGACKKTCDDEAECKSIAFFKGCHLFSTPCAKTKANIEADSMRVKGWAPNSRDELKAGIHACMRANDFTCTKGPKGPIGSWDVSRVTDPNRLFAHNSILNGEYYTTKFNGDISKWDVSRVTNMEALFNNARAFNGDISKWDVSNVKNMHHTFYHAEAFTGDISKWDVSNVKNMRNMFHGAKSFNGDVGKWDVSKVDNFLMVFGNAPSFSQVLCGEWKKNKKSHFAVADRWFENSPGKLC